jgi:hypothetical protein
MSTVAVDHARQQWDEGHRRLESHAADRALYLRLHGLVRRVLDELNRRVGQTFALSELVDAYSESDRWLIDVLGPVEQLSLVQDAAFYLYARGAVDYRP